MAKSKVITQAQLAGDQGEAFIHERTAAMGFLFKPYGQPEAGIDGILEIRDPVTGQVSGQLMAVQVKTTQHGGYSNETASGFDYLMDARDVEYWRGSNLPVILVVLNLAKREAYWKDARSGEGPDRRRLKFTKATDAFDTGARDAIAELCVSKGQWGVWFPPMKGEEAGHLNLVEAVLPQKAYIAPSPFKTGRQAVAELLKEDEWPPDDWIIRGGQFMSFRNPEGTALESIIDAGAIEEIDAEEIAYPDDEADERAIIELLRRTLSAQLDGLLYYDRKRKLYHFPAKPETIGQTYNYTSLKVKTSADVVKRYEKDGKTIYVRHHAFEPRFWRLDDRWLLSITPTFVFTWDGFKPDKFESSRLAGKKKLEVNSSLLGQFVMWRHLLTQLGVMPEADLFEKDTPALPDPVLTFRPIDKLALERGVPDDLWRASEPEPPPENKQGRLDI